MLWIDINRSLPISLTKQVCEQLRTKILKRDLQAGEKLPSTRKLARELNVSRNIISYSYEQLIAEGYLEGRKGSGTYVAEGIYLEQYKDYVQYEYHSDTRKLNETQNNDLIDFAIGVPDLSRLPRKIWAKLVREACLDASESLLGYERPAGLMILRQTLSKFLLKTKGIRCHPDQLVILSGAMHAFTILSKCLATSGNEVILEDPSANFIKKILTSMHLTFCPIPVDDHGIQVDLLSPDTRARCVIVTPSHHFPLGSILPIQRRVKLIEYARKTSTYIIENDFDSEFRYAGAPISALHLLDPGYVIYVGTFSESLYPGLRLGYMILPESLIGPCLELMCVSGVSAVMQLALAYFIQEGYLERHISKMKKCYRQKRETVIACLQASFGNRINIHGDLTGLYVMVEFRGIEFSKNLIEAIRQNGVQVYPVEDHAITRGRHANKIIIGYGNIEIRNIDIGIERMKHVLDNNYS
jgi:GntR family transcriptional regulator/MocR family aminotransferase